MQEHVLVALEHADAWVVQMLGQPRGRDQDIGMRISFGSNGCPGGADFEVIEQIGKAHMPVTVFVTAHNEYALRAFEVHALDYLTKPVEPERLRTTLARVKERIALQNAALLTQEQLKSVLASFENDSKPPKEHPKRLLVHNGAKDLFISVEDIEWIEAADYYSCLHVGTKNLMLRETIKQLASTLDPQKFVRIHRSVIVNMEHLQEIIREGQNEGSVVLTNGQRLKMSKAGWQEPARRKPRLDTGSSQPAHSPTGLCK